MLALQLVLAAATWVTHYGWPAWLTGWIGGIPYTVVAGGRLLALTTTAHVVVGSLTLAAAVSLALWWRRLETESGGEAVGRAAQVPRLNGAIAAYGRLVRPRIMAMVLSTMAVAAIVARPGPPDWPTLFHALAGSALVIAGAMALNSRAERASDARMPRTADRPLPSGRLTAVEAGWFGAVTSGLGLGYLAIWSDWATVGLAAVSWAVYVAMYTPMKTRSAWQTPLGALAGAMPVLARGFGRRRAVERHGDGPLQRRLLLAVSPRDGRRLALP